MSIVIFADDEPWYVRAFGERLEDQGHTVVYATNTKDAITKLRSLEHNDVLLILDISLPALSVREIAKMDSEAVADALKRGVWEGSELLHTVSASFPKVRVIVYSVHSEQEIRQRTKNLQLQYAFVRKGEDDANEDFYSTIQRELRFDRSK
jgi:CheY-like chemotaxis protein